MFASAAGTTVPAGIGARIGGALLDGLLFALCLIPAGLALVTGPTEISSCTVDRQGNFDFDGEFESLCEGPTSGTITIAVLLAVGFGIGFLVFQSHRQGKTGSTIGQGAVNVKTIDSTSGNYIGFGRALGRLVLAHTVSNFLCSLGYLWALWDPRKQTWHDKIVNSVVIKS